MGVTAVVELLLLASMARRSGAAGLRRHGSQRPTRTCREMEQAIRARKESTKWPKALTGRNLIIAGDSNDRLAVDVWHTMLEMEPGGLVRTEKIMEFSHPSLPITMHQPSEASYGMIYHIDHHNASIMFVFHFGAMSLHPEPDWHRKFLLTQKGHLPRFADPRKPFDETHVPQNVVSTTDLFGYWARAARERLPGGRPLRFLIQSSIWDVEPIVNSSVARRPNFTAADLAEWGWMKRLDQVLGDAKRAFPDREQLLWRTTPNCPLEDAGSENKWLPALLHVKPIVELQAQAVREAVKAQKGAWRGVSLMDWRKDYHATNPKQHCLDKWHYWLDGYRSYIQVLQQALDAL